MEATYITPGICNFSYIMMTSQVVKTILFFDVYSKTNNLRCVSWNRIIFQTLTHVELKIAKSETFDLLIVTRKLHITDMQNYTFSKSLWQGECIKGFEKNKIKFEIWPMCDLIGVITSVWAT